MHNQISPPAPAQKEMQTSCPSTAQTFPPPPPPSLFTPDPVDPSPLQVRQVSSLPSHVLYQAVTLQVLDQVADEKSLIIAVGYMLRSSPAVVAAKRLMQEVGCK